jgi:hypothetical protein
MYIYNVTVGVDKSIEDEWLTWLKEIHIPAIMRTGLFVDNKIYKVVGVDEQQSISYATQYVARSLAEIDQYLKQHAHRLQEEGHQKFGDKQATFLTVLEEVKSID